MHKAVLLEGRENGVFEGHVYDCISDKQVGGIGGGAYAFLATQTLGFSHSVMDQMSCDMKHRAIC